MDDNGLITRLYTSADITTLRSQDLQKTYIDNGSMSWVRCKALTEQKTWMPKRSKGYYMPMSRSIDINVPEDLELLSYFYKKQFEQNK